ncbi:hypothetical protein MJO28_006723 [Puccinia striiformis f. sp. tritici]|uniref:Uncharacterized protein n=1 Tax=Puccinia striiformis f. sp. tritici TaxID=168172 RepID=A0ACC0ELA5_9BASI|nr:hypothetical protein MJO28_006723 [Puccinia striiformis f. sp. tritici]
MSSKSPLTVLKIPRKQRRVKQMFGIEDCPDKLDYYLLGIISIHMLRPNSQLYNPPPRQLQGGETSDQALSGPLRATEVTSITYPFA